MEQPARAEWVGASSEADPISHAQDSRLLIVLALLRHNHYFSLRPLPRRDTTLVQLVNLVERAAAGLRHHEPYEDE